MAAREVEFAKVSFTPQGGPRVLSDVSLRVGAGETVALLGRSGSGKTTLLRMVNALVLPSTGSVRVGGDEVASVDVIALRRRIGYVIQEAGLFPHMTVARNIAMALELSGKTASGRAARAAEMLKLVGLPADFGERKPWQLSGGQRQRVGVARALAADPDVLLMDEPFGALDPLTRTEMQTMLRELLRRVGKTTLIVTHDLDEALYLADRIVLLEQGNIVADIAPREVAASENPAMRAYVAAARRTELAP